MPQESGKERTCHPFVGMVIILVVIFIGIYEQKQINKHP